MTTKSKLGTKINIFVCKIGKFFVSSATKKELEKPLCLPEGFTVTCHAGALGTVNNSINSVETCVEWGAQIVEFDVSFRPDGEPCLIHASSPAQNEGASFPGALAAVAKSNSCKINLDLKAWHNLKKVKEYVDAAGLADRVFYTGVSEKEVEQVRSAQTEIPYYLNVRFDMANKGNEAFLISLAEKIGDLGAIGINCHYSFADETMVRVMRERGLLVSVWTPNTCIAQNKMLSLSPDNITTKKPECLLYYIEQRKNK